MDKTRGNDLLGIGDIVGYEVVNYFSIHGLVLTRSGGYQEENCYEKSRHNQIKLGRFSKDTNIIKITEMLFINAPNI